MPDPRQAMIQSGMDVYSPGRLVGGFGNEEEIGQFVTDITGIPRQLGQKTEEQKATKQTYGNKRVRS